MPALMSLWQSEEALAGRESNRGRVLSAVLRPVPPPLGLWLVVAALLIAAETLVLYPLKRVAPVNLLLVVYLLGVMVVSVVWGFRPAIATAAASVLTFDFFHTPPLHVISLNTPEDHTAVAAFVVVALLTSALANLARSRAVVAERAAERARLLAEQQAALRRVATLVARGVSPAEVFAAVDEEMARCLHVPVADVFRYEPDGAAMVVASYSTPPVPHFEVGARLTLEGDNVAAMVLRTGHTARIDSCENASGSLAARLREAGIRSRVGAPIVVDGCLWGLAVIGSIGPDSLPPDTEERICDFAELVATALANAATRAELIASRARIVAAADDARRRLERDLHDGAQQRLVSLGLQVRMVESCVLPDETDLKKAAI